MKLRQLLHLLKITRPAFEPNSYVNPVLAKNAELNPGRYRIVPIDRAVGPKDDETLTFYYSDSGFGNGGELRGLSKWTHCHTFELTVQSINAERFLRENHAEELKSLKYIKVDAEGADFRILQLLENLITEYRPFIRTEVYRHMPTEERRELFQFLIDKDYTIYEIPTNTQDRKIPIDLTQVNHKPYYDIFCAPND